MPAFRWWEKEPGRLVVTNHPRDSALVESRLSNGRGLLADGGVSLSNVFSGDVPTSLLTMSTIGAGAARRGPAPALAALFVSPFGLTRALVLTVGEVLEELHQARRRRLRGVEPRIRRGGSSAALRGVTNVLLRELTTYLVAVHLRSGAPSLYCDFVDYDEIAHHAGPTRPEALASLDGIDRVLGTLEQVAKAAPRPYRFVVVSDHGQSQGATFRQRYGLRLEDLVRQLMRTGAVEVGVATHADEQRGRVGARLAGLDAERPDLVVVASGNLAMIYFARVPGHLTVEEIDQLHPRLLYGLAMHPGIGFVAVRSCTHGPLVLGAQGLHLLDDDSVEGADPLAPFGPCAADELRRHLRLPHVGDIVVNSRLDASTGEVAAFEELVGCHGGLGGRQSSAVLVHPAGWSVDRPLVGADAVHHQLVARLERVGQRRRLRQVHRTAG